MENPFEMLAQKIERLELLIEELKNQLSLGGDLGGYDMAARMTGYAKGTLRNMVSQGRIPHTRRGKKVYFSRDKLEQWAKSMQ